MEWLNRLLGRKRPATARSEDHEALLAELEAAARSRPDEPELHFNLALVQRNLGMVDAAIASYRRALALNPAHLATRSQLLLTLNYTDAPPAEVFAEHRRFGERIVQPVAAPVADAAWPRRLRIGYVSPDFYSHVTSSFTFSFLSGHDRSRFEIFCYHTGTVRDDVTARLRSLADHWSDCEGLRDAEIAERIRRDRIDILIDLAGHTADQRLGVFALRPAAVQATYLGYPNTTGVSAVDYRITDAIADPPGEAEALHTERLARLPNVFLCYRPGPDPGPIEPLPADVAGCVTFGCFNNFQKLSGRFFDAAARILAAAPGSRLLLKARPLGYPGAARRVRERFAAAGVDPARLVLRGWEPSPEAHLAAYREVDIALDSFPYNGTTTTCEAMWMGTPVVALRGNAHAGRVGATLLQAVGLKDLVGESLEQYVSIAVSLAADLPRLKALREGLRERMRASPLMDEPAFVRSLEERYLAMWRERRSRVLDDAQLARLWEAEPKDPAASVSALGEAIAASPDNARYRYMLGCSLEDLERFDEAIASYRKALELEPGMAKAANNLGVLLEMRGDLGEALRQYKAAAAADAQLPQALSNLGNLYARLGDRGQALDWLRRALALAPGDVTLLCRMGESCVTTWRLDEALEHYRAALALDANHWPVHFGLGNTLQALGLTEQAEASFRRALELGADLPEVHSNLLLSMHYHRGNDPEAMFAEHLAWARRYGSLVPRTAHPAPDPSRRRLNVGYVSPNFMQHAVAWAIEPVFAAHDREAFQVFFYSNVAEPDATTQRFMKLCDHWRDVSTVSSAEEARMVRDDKIDILVDLAVHTGGGRPMLFARKPAPVQVNWQGYPNTSGLAEVGYRITDEYADPPGESDRHHSEALVRMECGFFCYAPPPDAPEAGEPPSLAAGHITFGCFNNLAKVTPATLDLWSKLLHRVPGSRLFMKAHGLGAETARRNVLEHFARNGISAQRVRLLGPEDRHSDHLARYNEVDIALDPFPYHGTATTCEALWMGVPVVTLAGRTHVARVGVSILQRVGVPELIASTVDEYVELAAGLAGDVRRLRALRAELRSRLRNSSLLDSRRFARSLEAAYRDMWAKHIAAEEAGIAAAQAERIVEVRGGVRMCVPASLETASTYVLLEQEDWFEDEIRFVRRYLRPGMHAVDVGANIGIYSAAMAASVGSGGRVWCFEPTPRSAALLGRMLELNGFRHATLVRSAVSDREGAIDFRVTEHSELNAVGSGAESVRVDATTLDRAAREHGWKDVAFVKIDVEGHEAAVIEGARGFLAEASPLVQLEVRAGTEFNLSALDALARLGYAFYRLLPHWLVLVPFDRSERLDGYQLNLFACKPDRAGKLAADGLLVGQRTAVKPGAGDAMAAYARSREGSRPLAERLASLREAFDRASAAVREKPSLARRASLARIAWELGERTIAVAQLEKAVAQAEAGEGTQEPFLMPSPRYEAMPIQGEPGEWLHCALTEQYEKLRVFSSCFGGTSSTKVLAGIADRPYRSPEMERRRQLVALRAGIQSAPQPTALVATRSDENLNPDFWR